MTDLNVNPSRFDPYKNFKFRIKWDGRYVAGISKVSPLERMTQMVEQPKLGDPDASGKSSRRTKYDAITLERGITHDGDFEQWASRVLSLGSGLRMDVALRDLRKDIVIEVYNEAGRLTLAYKVLRSWVSEYQSLPDLDANANAVGIQHMKLENEGVERDDCRKHGRP